MSVKQSFVATVGRALRKKVLSSQERQELKDSAELTPWTKKREKSQDDEKNVSPL